MAAVKDVARKPASKVAFGKVLAIQVVAYVALVALALIPGITYGDPAKPAVVSFSVIGSLALIALLVAFNPFRDGVAGHVIAVVAGLLSVVCATTMMMGHAIFPAAEDGSRNFSMEEGWIAGVGGLLIVLVIVSFGRQMARENRTHLIRSLSHGVVEGAAMIASAGWCFLPTLLPTTHDKAIAVSVAAGVDGAFVGPTTMTWAIAAVVVLLVAVALGVCSYFWHRDSDPESNARAPWIGIALLPVMLTGAVVGIAAFAAVTF